jgi:hypothetical protein
VVVTFDDRSDCGGAGAVDVRGGVGMGVRVVGDVLPFAQGRRAAGR